MNKFVEAWKVFDTQPNITNPFLLFHGIKGAKCVVLDQEMVAVNKMVTNPGKTGQGQSYLSGFHVCTSQKQMEEYSTRFTSQFKRRKMCRVFVSNLRDKPGSKVKLADRMIVRQEDWEKALSV